MMIDPLNSEIFTFEQRSDEWYEKRLGTITASKISKCFTPVKRQLSKKCMNDLAIQLCAEKALGYQENVPITDDMLRGIESEPEAVRRFEKKYDCVIDEVGFVYNKELNLGCSPDGINWEKGYGLEIKTPNPKNYIKCALYSDWTKYIPQCAFSAMLLGFDSWKLYIFNEHVHDKLCVIDIYVEEHREKIETCITYLNEQIKIIGDQLAINQ